MPNIGENIKKIRMKKGLTQKQLGDLCDPPMADSAIRRYESGKANPKIGTTARISRALGVTIGDLDPEYYEMNQDKNDAINLNREIAQFLDEIPSMSISEESKITNTAKALEIQTKLTELIETIDNSIARDKKMKEKLDEKRQLKNDIEIAEQKLASILLSIFYLLNTQGKIKATEQVELLSRIPEYQKNNDDPEQE